MKSYFSRLRYLYVNFSRQLCRIRASLYWIKLLTSHWIYHASENSQHRTGDKLWGASCEVKPVPSPREALLGLSPQTKLQAPLNWNMTRYKSMQLLSTLNVKTPLHKRKDPPHKRKPSYWRLSGDGSAWNHPFQESDVVVVNVTSQSRNPCAIPIRDAVLTKKCGKLETLPKI